MSWRHTVSAVRSEVIGKPWETLKLAVPSFLYMIQNNVVYVALTNLDAATFQISYQVKILVTAVLSYLMLKKEIRRAQWLALVLLLVGVCLVQVDKVEQERAGAANGSSEAGGSVHRRENSLVGLLAVLTAAFFSAYSGVYFERLLKFGQPQTLGIKNLQLSTFSVPFSSVAVLVTDFRGISEHGFFYGYSVYTWIVIFLQAFGGIAVSFTMKYADNILKCFATSVSILLSTLASWWLLDDVRLTTMFSAGALLVSLATVLYSYFSPPPPLAAGAPDKFKELTGVVDEQHVGLLNGQSQDHASVDEDELCWDGTPHLVGTFSRDARQVAKCDSTDNNSTWKKDTEPN